MEGGILEKLFPGNFFLGDVFVRVNLVRRLSHGVNAPCEKV